MPRRDYLALGIEGYELRLVMRRLLGKCGRGHDLQDAYLSRYGGGKTSIRIVCRQCQLLRRGNKSHQNGG